VVPPMDWRPAWAAIEEQLVERVFSVWRGDQSLCSNEGACSAV
jgi:hypothetical protein